MKNRSELRDVIVKVIYQINIYKESKLDYDVDAIIKDNLEIENNYVNEMVDGILKNEVKLRGLANKYLKNWTMDRLSNVDQAILLLGIYELLEYKETPSIVAINEAIELSKRYSDESVTRMINGVLDKIYHEEEKLTDGEE